jgi:hypothetical protein
MDNELNRSAERPLRDLDRWREKVEVRLDSRQVVLLFLGCAVVSCILFSLGIVVGKRIEARARPNAAPVDPLEALDRLAAEEVRAEDLSFPRTLAGTAPSAASGSPAAAGVGELASAERSGRGVRAKPALPPAAKSATVASRPAEGKAGDDDAETDGPEAAGRREAARAEAVKRAAAALAKAEPASETKPDSAKPEVKADAKGDGKVDKAKLRYTLHVTTVPTRGEAVELAKRLEAQGLRAVITPEISPDRGPSFRVRVGDFPSYQDAIEAKSEFERKQGRIVYVSKL